MLTRINTTLDKLMPLITPISVILGLWFAEYLHSYSFIVPWVFAFMTFSGSLSSGFHQFFQVFKQPLPLIAVLIILHIVMPLIAWATGNVFFSDDPLTLTGIVLAMSIPTGITSMIWVSIYKGNIPVTLSLILIDTFLSPFIVPFTLSVLVGSQVSMDSWGLMKGLLYMVVLPSFLGMLLNHLSSGKIKSWGPKLSPFSKLGTVVVIAINGAVVAPYLVNVNWKLIMIIVFMIVISSFAYVIGWLFARVKGYSRDLMFSIVFNSGMRNTVAGVALAVSFFPAPVSIPVIVGTILQQLVASQFGYLINRSFTSKTLKKVE